ncbi:DUF2207 domain-containing protein [Streptomyces sp. NPDC059524]|uniref:DUF2207 domain-containing protein n=1 Tax=Streptomyces sp. NPDC059524 TaxID=3346856 RepID=UPI00368D71C4
MTTGSRGGRRRRLRGWIAIGITLAVFAGAVAVAQIVANKERVTAMWVRAEIRADGSARVTEVIDYDFGHSGTTHGIYRDVPDADFYASDVRATMDGHPVPFESTYGDEYREANGRSSLADRLKVGDPDRTVGGVHRYRIAYTVPEVVKKGRLAWDAVGTGWQVDRARVEIHVVDPRGLTRPRCVYGTWDHGRPCAVRQAGPGHLVVRRDRLTGHEGLTLYAGTGHAETDRRAALPPAPEGPAVGTTLPQPLRDAWIFLAVALGCALLTVVVLRRAGRDRLGADGGRRVEIGRLAGTVAPSSTPPQDLTPAQGGVLHTETIEDRHKVAWLLNAAAEGRLIIEGDDRHPVLRRPEEPVLPANREIRDVLDMMFADRTALALGARDPWFKKGWNDIAWKLGNWRKDSGLWETGAFRAAPHAVTACLIAGVLGLALAVTGGALEGRRIAAGTVVVIVAAVLSGTSVAALVRLWELERRTPLGSARWLEVEAFRRYLADPASCPGEPLDERRTDLYTAWAVSLGVASAWESAVDATTVAVPVAAGRRSTIGFTEILLAAAVVSAMNPPSSGGSSGGSGGGSGGGSSSGGVGGGAGGGGGGSW